MADSFSTVASVRLLLRFKWLILGVSLVAAVGTYLYTRTLPNYYKSTINCVPAANDQGVMGGALSGLSTALKDFGLNKISGKQGEQYEFIVVLFTRQIRDSMIARFGLVDEYELAGRAMKDVRGAFEDNLDIELHAEGNYEISIWSRDSVKAAEMCRAFVSYANAIANDIHRKDASKTYTYVSQRIAMIDSTLDRITDSLSKFSREHLMFAPEEQAKASASALADAKVDLMKQQTILGLLQSSYGEDDPQVRSQATMVRQMQEQFDKAQNQPGFAGNFAITDAAGIGANYMRMLGDFEAHAKLKAFLMPTLEQAELDRMKSTPSLLVVDDPIPAEKKDRPKRALIAAGTGLGAGILVIILLLGRHAYVGFMGPTTSKPTTPAAEA